MYTTSPVYRRTCGADPGFRAATAAGTEGGAFSEGIPGGGGDTEAGAAAVRGVAGAGADGDWGLIARILRAAGIKGATPGPF
jgi:hypothetical protein